MTATGIIFLMRIIRIFITKMNKTELPQIDGDASRLRQDTRRDVERVVSSTQLLDPGGRLIIEHRGERYALRETRLGKLILTK